MLNSDRVNEVFMDCLFRDGEKTDNHVLVKAVMASYGFHPKRLEQHRQDVREMLAELPDQFKQSKGKGWSFLNACEDKHGHLWSGLHAVVDQLFALGMALKLVSKISLLT